MANNTPERPELEKLLIMNLSALREELTRAYRERDATVGELEERIRTLEAERTDYRELIALSEADLRTARTALGNEERHWQPIETAPKDGTHVDLWIPEDATGNNGGASRSSDCKYERGRWRLTGDFDLPWLKDATHWMPIPSPPDAARKGATEE